MGTFSNKLHLWAIVPILLAMSSFACSGGPGQFVSGKKKDSDKKVDKEDTTGTTVPADVAGAFLNCAFMGSKAQVTNNLMQAAALMEVTGVTEIACGIPNTEGWTRDYYVVKDDNKRLTLEQRPETNPETPFTEIVRVPNEDMKRTLQAEASKGSEKRLFNRSILTINQFNAEQGQFDLASDEQFLDNIKFIFQSILQSPQPNEVSGPRRERDRS